MATQLFDAAGAAAPFVSGRPQASLLATNFAYSGDGIHQIVLQEILQLYLECLTRV
jgi:hypothetical protein